MTSVQRALRLLIIGSGRRVQNNYLPCLTSLQNEFQIVGIHSRTKEKLLPVADKWSIDPILNLNDVDFSKIDVVSISVPTSQNAIVLKQLLPFAKNLTIIIDTPIAGNKAEAKAVLELLPQFKKVTVTEDYMNFPTFNLLRQAVRDGAIGQVKGLVLSNIGYLYHGLALIRSFSGFSSIVAARDYKLGSGIHSAVSYFFPDKMRATVIGPYLGHHLGVGDIVVEGTTGAISTNIAEVHTNSYGKPTYHLEVQRNEKGDTIGAKIKTSSRVYEASFHDVIAMRTLQFSDKSNMNLERGAGLAEVFRYVAGHRNINSGYGYKHAIYDSFASRAALSGKKDLDPFNLLKQP